MNPFLDLTERAVWGPGTLEMALPLVEAVGIRPGMRVLEVGGGSGQVATILATHWDVNVVALEPWHGGRGIQSRAERSVIVRLNPNPRVFAGTRRTIETLAALGLSVAHILAADLTRGRFPAAYVILAKIPGRDLRYALSDMTRPQMATLAQRLAEYQRAVGTLPQGAGFGYVPVGERGPYASWTVIVEHDVRKSLSALEPAAPADVLDRLGALLTQIRPYLDAVQPVCFLDDVTTKNVIVDQGKLRGIVDLDFVCYGDPLYWLGLTQTAVVCDIGEHGVYYLDDLFRCWSPTAEQRQIVDAYSAIHSLDFAASAHRSTDVAARERILALTRHWLRRAPVSAK